MVIVIINNLLKLVSVYLYFYKENLLVTQNYQ